MPSVFVLSYSGTPLHCAAARRGAAASEAAASVSAQASVVCAGGRRRRRRRGASGAEASGAPRERIAAGVRRVGAAPARPKVRSTQQNVELDVGFDLRRCETGLRRTNVLSALRAPRASC